MNGFCPECDGSGFIYIPCLTCNEYSHSRDIAPGIGYVGFDDPEEMDWDWAAENCQ